MTTFWTMNPVGSKSPKDLSDNAENIDVFVNSQDDSWVTRLGEARKTLYWMQRASTGIPAIQASIEAAISALEAATARDAAQLSAGVFDTKELGIIATNGTANKYFSVPVPNSSEYLILYKNESGNPVEISRYPSASAVYNISDKLENILPFTIYPSLDPNWPWSICDINGVIILGISALGEVYALGIAQSGSQAYADGPIGAQDIFALISGAPYQITSVGDNFSPSVSGSDVSFIQRNGPVSQMKVALPEAGSVATFVTKFSHLISYGQSLAMGSMSSAATIQAQVANRLFTLNAGVRLANQDGTLTAGMVAPFKPMVAATTETPCVQMAGQMSRIRAIPSDSALLVSCHGRGGHTIDQLAKGSLYYTNMMTAISAAKAECARLGLEYDVPFMHFRQGEADRALAAGVYASKLVQLQSDFETDVNALLGSTGRRPLLIEQLSNITSYSGYTTSEVIFDQLKVSVDYPDRFILTGPGYFIEHAADGTHMLADGYQRLGCNNARAAKGFFERRRFIPTSARSAKRTGDKVIVDFYVPFPPLVLDLVNVTDPGNYGFRWSDSTNSATVTSVRLITPSSVEVSLSAVPTGSDGYIGIADIGTAGAAGGPRTGMRSNLRDSSQDFDSFGVPLYNWACHQRIAVI